MNTITTILCSVRINSVPALANGWALYRPATNNIPDLTASQLAIIMSDTHRRVFKPRRHRLQRTTAEITLERIYENTESDIPIAGRFSTPYVSWRWWFLSQQRSDRKQSASRKQE